MKVSSDTCLETVRQVIASGDAREVPTAEDAIAVFVGAHDGPSRQTGALNVVDEELDKEWLTPEGRQAGIIGRLSEFVWTRMQRLKPQR